MIIAVWVLAQAVLQKKKEIKKKKKGKNHVEFRQDEGTPAPEFGCASLPSGGGGGRGVL